MLAEGVRLHPGVFLHKVTVLKEDLDKASKEDIRVIWDALGLSGAVIVELDPDRRANEKVKKTGRAGVEQADGDKGDEQR